MAPALTKFLKDGHGVHFSPPTSDEQAMYSMDVDPQLRSSDDLQKMLLNLSALPSLDSYLQPYPLNVPTNTGVSSGHCESLVLPTPGSLVSSYNKGLRESHQVASMLPGVPDMFLVPLPDHNSQEACFFHRDRNAPECRSGADDLHSIYSLTTVSPPFAHGDSKSFFALKSVSDQETSVFKRLGSDQLVPGAVLEGAVKERLSRQSGLHSRACRLQKRLQALLGHHAMFQCDQQLVGLKAQGYHRGLSLDSISAGAQLSQVGTEHHFPWLETSPHFTEIKEFSQSSHAVLRGLQEALDSDATANSSSDDELEDIKTPSKNREPCVALPSGERWWLEERAELGSRWSWLQLRVAELDGRIHQLEELHKKIRSTKGSVVLAESQPMTDRQIQQTLLREMAGLSYTAMDADNEPCSPTRLLHNIERQSAELSQIVNSLMPPLCLSPLSKQPQARKDKTAFNIDVFVPGSSKRRKFGVRRRQLFKADRSCVCARTRPLVTYHKPKLFVLNPGSPKFSGRSTSSLSSGLKSCCSSCDPVLVCSDPVCSSNWALSSRTSRAICHDSSPFSHFPKTSAREEWSQIPLIINAQPLSPALYSSTPLHNIHKYKLYTRHHRKRVVGLSPIRHAGSSQRQQDNRKRKKRRRHSFTEDDEEDLSYIEDSSDEVVEESYTLVSRKQGSQGAIRRRQGESMFNIDNIVIPVSLTKVEKLQYKDILTPSWQVVDIQSLLKNEAETEEKKEEQMEVLTDEVFAQRHLALEQKEKMRWSFWGKKHCRLSSRSGSRLSSSGGGLCTSGEENSVEWSFAQLDIDEQLNSEECLPQAPWDLRVFPLNDDEEQALLSEVPHWCSETASTFSLSKTLNFDFWTPQLDGATPPSSGQCMDSTNNGS